VKYSTQVLSIFLIVLLIELSTHSIPISPPIVMYFMLYSALIFLVNIAFNNVVFNELPLVSKNLFKIYWLYSLFIIFFGFVKATSYWDYKYIFVSYIPGVLTSLVILIGADFQKNLYLFKLIINKLFPLAIIIGLVVWSFEFLDIYAHSTARLTSIVFIFILAFPFLKPTHRYLIIFISVLSILIEPGYRANVIRIIISWVCVFFYYFFLLKPRIINILSSIIILLPLFFLQAGIQGKLDVFKYLSESNLEAGISKANTRSILYEEVLWSLNSGSSNLIIGGGASAGHYSEIYFEKKTAKQVNIRYQTEVGFLNTLFKSGLVGVIFDLLIILIPAYYAVNYSRNNFSKILGFYLIFSWIFYFVERPLMLNINNFLFFLIIGICLNKTFRDSTDNEIKYLLKSI
tara:strand:+ start:853 stop:2061 length:1209 start_codon:yes stop_codon:yes gene_type:complete